MWRNMAEVLRQQTVWGQAGVIICAYCAFKGLDNYSLYAVQALGMDEVEAARLAAWGAYLRPVAAVLTGVAADRYSARRLIAISFAALVVFYGTLSVAVPSPGWRQVIFVNLFGSFFFVFALRGVYFALLEETGTPQRLTGTTVGAVSFIGYTPEVFFAPLTGRVLDQAPGLPGLQHYFALLAVIAAIGLVVVSVLRRLRRPAE